MAWSWAAVSSVGLPDWTLDGDTVWNGGRDSGADGVLIGPPWLVQPASRSSGIAAAAMIDAGRMVIPPLQDQA
jgi:hypothetical protein